MIHEFQSLCQGMDPLYWDNMNYSRADLVQTNATMNQLRNTIYHLQRFMKRNDITEVRSRLKRMGKNIAHTYLNTWRPIEKVTLTNIKDVLATIYKSVLNSILFADLLIF